MNSANEYLDVIYKNGAKNIENWFLLKRDNSKFKRQGVRPYIFIFLCSGWIMIGYSLHNKGFLWEPKEVFFETIIFIECKGKLLINYITDHKIIIK